MAFAVQDDSGSVAGANSYLSVVDFKTYHDDRGNSYVGYTDPQIQLALVKATDYLDTRFRFVGRKFMARLQNTEWPRIMAYDADGRYVQGIPVEVKEATAEYALRALSLPNINPDPVRDESGQLVQSKSDEVGPIKSSVTYVDGSAYSLPKYPVADNKLRKAGLTISGGIILRS